MSIRHLVCFAVISMLALSASAALDLPSDKVIEATEPGGAVVPFQVTVVAGGEGDDGRTEHTVTCTPPSLSLFPLGTTTVNCTGSEGSTGSFTITVTDSVGPDLTLPRDITVVTAGASEVVTFTASATDTVDGSVAVVCTPASGSTFALGTTGVACSASDSRGNTSSAGFDVHVVTEPPPPGENPDDVTAEATGPAGAAVIYGTGPSDDDGRPGGGDGCSPASGSLFPLGPTTVTCPALSFVVTVVDTTPPEIHLPGSPLVVISTVAAAVTYDATADDLVDGSVAVDCTPVSASTFALGSTAVSCTASDSRGNTATATFDVFVGPAPPAPSDITVEATSAAGAVVTYDFTCSPPSGATFPLGTTLVTCGELTFFVTVEDTTPPVLVVPADFTLPATSAAGAIGTFTATASDTVDSALNVACEPPSGSTFPLGLTVVNCTATDDSANSSGGSFEITVSDVTPPVFASLTASPDTLWSPNNKMVEVTLTAVVTDNVDAVPTVQIVGVTSNESIVGDFAITGPLTLDLRATREGNGPGRTYTIEVEAVDEAGNRSVATVTVLVPRDQSSKRRAIR